MYQNDITGYVVLNAIDLDTHKSFIIVFNNGMINPRAGFKLIVSGDWVNNSKYGKQFQAVQYQEIEPDEIDGIISYLASGFFEGIKDKTAKKIVSVFGTDTLKVIENEPEKLKQVKGLGEAKIQALVQGYLDHKYIQEIVTYFSKYGITINMIMKIYREYGKDAIQLVEENPYRLASEIDGIGFRRADDIAMKLGTDKYDFNRQASCIEYVLTEETDNGHTFLYDFELVKDAKELLDIESINIQNTIQTMVNNGDLIKVDNDKIFSKNLYYAELNTANKIKRLRDFVPFVPTTAPKSIEEIEKEIGITYNERQKEAILTALKSNVMVLTGGPGTGKTTALLGIIKALKSLDMSISGAAPTGRAAKRMSEVTGLDATTIHRLLEYNPMYGYQRNEENPLTEDVIIIDEVSMVNIFLMNNLLKAVKPSTKLILVGDENQLPCIGPGNILHDIIFSEVIPVITLNEIFRQAEGSKIIINSHNIINDKPIIINNSDPDTDFFFIQNDDPDYVARLIDELVSERLPRKYGVKPTEVQVLSPRRKDVSCSANHLNKILQASLNHSTVSIKYGDNEFKVGDKVMQIKNNYEKDVFNGDVGFIEEIDTEKKEIVVKYDDDFVVRYGQADFDEIILAYASTIHKSQGSEYPIVVIPVLMSHYIMLKRNLIYTGITRAKKICVLIGEKKALTVAINNNQYDKRNTMLEDWLRDDNNLNIKYNE